LSSTAAMVSRDRLAGKRAPPGEHLEKHATKRPDIRSLVDRLPSGLLWAHVGSCSEDHAEARESRRRESRDIRGIGRQRTRRFEGLRESEIENLDRPVRSELDVG